MNAFVTGGAGYIGSNLCDLLIQKGFSVSVLDNLSTGSERNIAHLTANPRFRFVRGSILDSPELDGLVRGADRVYHLAAAVGVKYICDDPIASMTTNIRGTERVLEAAFRHRRRTVIASSSEVYGKSNGEPLQEDGERVLGPTRINRWSYSISKAIDEHLAYAYADQGMPVSIIRYFNSYGPRISETGYGSVVANFVRQALKGEPLTVHGDGSQTRSFTYVADTVRGTYLANEVPEAIGEVFNIGADTEISILELALAVRDLVGSKSEVVHIPHWSYYGASYEDTARRRPDPARAMRVLGFRAEVPLREGLRRTVEWCKRNYEAADATTTRKARVPAARYGARVAEPIAA